MGTTMIPIVQPSFLNCEVIKKVCIEDLKNNQPNGTVEVLPTILYRTHILLSKPNSLKIDSVLANKAKLRLSVLQGQILFQCS